MKQALRNEITSLKKRHAEEDLHKYSSQIFERLIQTEEFKEAECILAYYSFWGEVFTHDFIEKHKKNTQNFLLVLGIFLSIEGFIRKLKKSKSFLPA